MRCAVMWAGLALALGFGMGNAHGLPEVEPVDLNEIDLADFTDLDLDVPAGNFPNFPLPYYVAHFHRLANAVVEEGEHRGFIDLSVWRRPQDNEPYNARIMENILSLAYFYCTDEPWNPYYGDEAVRARMEAAMEFWVGMRSEDGLFSEYGWESWNRPATAFATKFMGETLRLLDDGPPIDPDIHQQVIEANRDAFRRCFEDGLWIEGGARMSNQWGNFWPGAMAHIDLFDDQELDEQLRYWINETSIGGEYPFQSVTGYFHEANGPCWRYNFGTHMSNTLMAWHYAQGRGVNVMTEDDPELMDWLIREHELFADWVSYNAVLEPDESEFVLNRAIETRQRKASFEYRDFPMAEVVEGLRSFIPTREEAQERRDAFRAGLEAAWPVVEELELGSTGSFSPYAFLHRPHELWYPTNDQREEARARLPYLASDTFTHQRTDGWYVFSYVRRPDYYAAFSMGNRGTGQQRLGLGLLWHPDAGTMMQSHSGRSLEAWGTRAEGADNVHEAVSIYKENVEFSLDGEPFEPEEGVGDLPNGEADFAAVYPLGEDGEAGVKTVSFTDGAINVTVNHGGAFREEIPLRVLDGDELAVEGDTVTLRRGTVTMVITFNGAESIEAAEAEEAEVIVAQADGELEYAITWETE